MASMISAVRRSVARVFGMGNLLVLNGYRLPNGTNTLEIQMCAVAVFTKTLRMREDVSIEIDNSVT